MKTIYFAQPNSKYGNSIYFPYAAGTLLAYAFADPVIQREYCFKGFVYKREDLGAAVAKMENPYLVAFSCYVWNYEYNKALAAAIKKKWPGCLTVFGGHQIFDRCDAADNGDIDILMFGEGEESFRQLLLALSAGGELDDIPNIMFRRGGETVSTPKAIIGMPDRVSPYLGGWFDGLLEDEKEMAFSAILETNRGCPNRCSFCDWGNIKSRVRQYDRELVKAEIDWFAEHQIEYVYAADANFGLFRQDEEYIDYLIERHAQTGYPQKFQATYSKNNPDVVFRLNKKLNEAGMSKGATLSFQSMSPEVLVNIYRKNMPLERFRELMRLYHEEGIPAYSELILGLPGETYGSFRDGLEELLRSGQHMSINIFNCELLNNSILNDPAYMAKYDIRTAKIEQHQYHIIPDKDSIPEYSNMVISTSSMPADEWIRSSILGVYMRAFHNLGLLQCFAIYLFYEKQVGYMDLYERLIGFSKDNPGSVCGRLWSWLYGKYSEILTNKGSLTWAEPAFGELTWPIEEAAFLKIMKELPRYKAEIREFLEPYFPDDEELFEDLFRYQHAVVKTPGAKKTELTLSHNWYKYFQNVYKGDRAPLENGRFTCVVDPGDICEDLPGFAKNTIWFGRRGGQNIVEDITVS